MVDPKEGPMDIRMRGYTTYEVFNSLLQRAYKREGRALTPEMQFTAEAQLGPYTLRDWRRNNRCPYWAQWVLELKISLQNAEAEVLAALPENVPLPPRPDPTLWADLSVRITTEDPNYYKHPVVAQMTDEELIRMGMGSKTVADALWAAAYARYLTTGDL